MARVANPLLPGCFPDPSICRVGEWHHLVTSTFELLPGIPVLRSRDLVSWETVGHVIDRPGMVDLDGVRSSGGVFAPTIRHDGERFWVVSTVVDPDRPGRGGTFVCHAERAEGPWSDPVWIDVAGIDPSLLVDDDGRIWMHGTRLVAEPEWPQQTEVWVRELSRDSMTLVGDEHVVWTGAVRGAVWAEGPHLLRTDEGVLLLAAEGGTAEDHAVCVARAPHPTGPYVGSPRNPVLTHRHLGRSADVQSVGHADLVQDADGRWWSVLLGTRPYDGVRHPLGRETFLCPVAWEDGWPVFAPGVGRVPAQVEVPGAVDPASGTWQPDARRAGDVLPDDPRWMGVRALPAEVAEPSGDGWLLRATGASLASRGAPAFVGVRLQHRDVDVAVAVEPGAHGAVGLVVRQSEDDHVRVLAERHGAEVRVRAVQRRQGVDVEIGEVSTHADEAGLVRLALAARGPELALRVRDERIGVVDARELDTSARGGFLGLWVGVALEADRGEHARTGAFCYRPVVPSGHAGVAA